MAVIDEILKSMEMETLLRIRYRSLDGSVSTRLIQAYSFRFGDLYGWDVALDEIRRFKVRGILNAEATDTTFSPQWEIEKQSSKGEKISERVFKRWFRISSDKGRSFWWKVLQDSAGVEVEGMYNEKRGRDLYGAISLLPENFVKKFLKELAIEDLGPINGQWIDGKIRLNYRIFDIKGTVGHKGYGGLEVPKLIWVIVHEIAHGLDELLALADKKEWLDISGWKNMHSLHYDGLDGEDLMSKDVKLPEGYARYEEKRPQWIEKIGRYSLWLYKKEKEKTFVQRYSSRSPYEDFADTFTAFLLGVFSVFKEDSEVLKKKFYYVKKSLNGYLGVG